MAYEWSHHWLDEHMFPPPLFPAGRQEKHRHVPSGRELALKIMQVPFDESLAGWKTVCSPGGCVWK